MSAPLLKSSAPLDQQINRAGCNRLTISKREERWLCLPLSVLEEFRSSAIPRRLTMANVRWVEGDEAVEILTEHAIAQVQRVTSYLTQPAKQILKCYEFARSGGWVAFGTTLAGGAGSVAYFKPKSPRLDFEKRKRIKYETAAKAEALPLLPFVDDETAAKVYQRYSATPLEGETFWQVVKRCDLPTAFCEGFKKALSLIAHGIPAIAIRGITQWHKKGSSELHDAIADFATPGRQIYVIFDQDEKPTTQRDVRTQALKFGAALEQCGCKVALPVWGGQQLGKGIDDVLFKQGDAAQSCLDGLLANAPSIAQYRQIDRIQKALERINHLNRLSYPVERATEGDYLPQLPQLQPGAIHAVAASMNAGKTTRIGADWVKSAIAQGLFVLVIAPLNSLGEQTARNLGLPHLHDYGTSRDQQKALWADVAHSRGLVMCPDSLHRLPDWFFDRPVLLVLDEANQVIASLTEGNTLKSRQAEILEKFAEIARRAVQSGGAIILSEDGLPDRAIKFVQSVSGAKTVRVFTHQKQGNPWDCKIYRGQASGYRARFLEAAAQTQPLLYVASSQAEGERMERAIARRRPGLKVDRIDSKTNQGGRYSQFFTNPDEWLQANRPDVLILSPSVKSGVSIEGGISAENAYFKAVWGYFSVLDTDTHAQLLGRYRPSVPRVVFCPDFVLTSGDESLAYPRAIKRRLQSNAKALAGVYGIEEMLQAEGERAELLATIETATLDYLCDSVAVSGAQKSIAHHALVDRLERAGHCVTSEKIGKDAATVTLWKDIQEELWREQATAIASGVIDLQIHTLKWALQTLDALEATLEDRTLARKVLWRNEFPGVLFDDAEECYQALVKDYGAMGRGVTLQAKAENLEAALESDRAATEAILKGDIRALHRLPKGYARALLLSNLGVLSLLQGTYSNTDERAIAVKAAALKFAREIAYWLRLQIKPDQTPVEIANKLLKKLGLEAISVSRPGARGQQNDRLYQVSGQDNPIRLRLLEALRRKLSSSVSTICNKENPSIQIVDTSPQTSYNWDSPESIAVIRGLWEAADAPEVREEIRRLCPPGVFERAIA